MKTQTSLKVAKMIKYLDKPKNAEKDEMTIQRDFVISEIMATEKGYFDKLQVLMDVFITPLEATKILVIEDLKTQFSGLKKIYSIHLNMYHSMFEMSNSKEINIPTLFAEFVSKLSEYQEYLVNFSPALARRGVLQTRNRQFSSFVKQASQDPRCSEWDLESLLIAPVQRIPRYRLLFEQLLRYTSETHPEYTHIVRALNEIKSVADSNNEAIRMRERQEELMKIMMRVDDTSRVDLLDNPNRFLVRQGPLKRQCRLEVKVFDFYLLSDLLLYCEHNPMLGTYKINKIIPLTSCQIIVSPPSAEHPELAFTLESPQKSFVAWAKTIEEKNAWVLDLTKTISDAKRVSMHLHPEIPVSDNNSFVAPVWQPDSSSTECLICGHSFTLFKRRHHCRNCGSMICNDCSMNRVVIPLIKSDKPARICDACHVSPSLMERFSTKVFTSDIRDTMCSPPSSHPGSPTSPTSNNSFSSSQKR